MKSSSNFFLNFSSCSGVVPNLNGLSGSEQEIVNPVFAASVNAQGDLHRSPFPFLRAFDFVFLHMVPLLIDCRGSCRIAALTVLIFS